MANITDVAKLAGVSPGTVSKYLNNADGLREPNRLAIEAAIEKLQYTPNLLARNLRINSSSTIAVVAQEITNPFHALLYNTVRKCAQKNNYSVVLYSVDDIKGNIAGMFGQIPVKYFSGILLCYLIDMPQAYSFALANQSVPTVVISNDLHLSEAHPDICSVYIDIKKGIMDVVDHLVGLDMRKIAFLSSATDQPEFEPKMAGFLQALNQHGLEPANIVYPNHEFSAMAGYELASQLLECDEMPDAVIVGSDIMAMGVMRCLADHGIQVPRDLLLASCDNIMLSSVYCPALTTVNLPIEEASSKACQLLLDQISKKPLPGGVTQFSTQLVVRETTNR
ncbi:MAG: LacI family DNA-binding transcriptional regulator [Oscillospiraceae bacterium]